MNKINCIAFDLNKQQNLQTSMRRSITIFICEYPPPLEVPPWLVITLKSS